MLVWAREEIGYTIEQGAEALGISVENLKAAEAGERPLTLNQLRDAAEKYDFPFGYFYLSNPPYNKTFKPIPDFRIEPGLVGVNHHRLGLEIKKCRDRRDIFLDLATSMEIQIKPFELPKIERLKRLMFPPCATLAIVADVLFGKITISFAAGTPLFQFAGLSQFVLAPPTQVVVFDQPIVAISIVIKRK